MRTYRAPDFANLSPDIARLFLASGDRSFFGLAGWFALVAECGLDSGANAPSIAVDDQARIGIVYEEVPGGTIVHGCTNLYACAFDVLGERAGGQAIQLFAKEFASKVCSGRAIHLKGIDSASPSFQALMRGFRAAGFVVKPYFGWGTWFERTEGLGFEDYFSKRPSILRNTWKRKRTMLENSATAAIRTYGPGEELDTCIAAYEGVRERSWKEAEPFPLFVPRLVRFASEIGALRSGILSIDKAPVAAQFWIVWAGRATIFKLVYDENFSTFSPGTLLTMEMFRSVLENDRPREIDFGRGDDAYKKLWLGSRREHWGIEAASPRSIHGLAAATRLTVGLGRDFLKSRFKSASRPEGSNPRG